jgi:hypothetical protein
LVLFSSAAACTRATATAAGMEQSLGAAAIHPSPNVPALLPLHSSSAMLGHVISTKLPSMNFDGNLVQSLAPKANSLPFLSSVMVQGNIEGLGSSL